MLATAQAIAAQTIRSSATLESFADNFGGRLAALAGAHDLLSESSWRGASLLAVANGVLEPYQATGRIAIAGEELPLTPRAALALSLILHELATNAAKYGALSAPGGKIDLAWQMAATAAGRALRLYWRESGGPAVEQPTDTGFGLSLIERSVAYELDGAAKVEFPPDGLRCELLPPCTRDNFQEVAEDRIAPD